MQKITLTIRVEADDLAKWKVESNRAGMNLSEWVRRTANEAAAGRRKIEPEEYLGVEKPEAKKPTEKISESSPPTTEQRSVARGRGPITRIEDVTYPTIRKHIPEPGGTRSPGAKVTGQACKHGTKKGYHCWQCKGVAVIGDKT